MTADWADLPPELLHIVSGKLTVHLDYIRFRSVCSNWRSSSPNTPHHLPCQLPWLMLPQSRTSQTHRRGFFSLSSNTVHFLHLPESTHRRRRRGSSHGWLLILDESPSIFLLNPLTRQKLTLPPLSAFPNVDSFSFYDVGREYTLTARNGETYTRSLYEMRDSFVKKVVLSASPAIDTDFIAVAILSQTGEIAFCKNGDQSQSWRFIEGALPYCEDVIYWNKLFYAVNKFGEISVCYVHGVSPRVSVISPPLQIGGDMQYLVSSYSSDELLLVTRYLDSEFSDQQIDIVYRTVQFRVYSLDLSGPKWVRVTSLGDQVVFLGENSSLALRASDYSGCKANCIYFTDDYSESNYDGVRGDLDLGIYNMEDGNIEPLPCYPRQSHSRIRWPAPVWVTPNPR